MKKEKGYLRVRVDYFQLFSIIGNASISRHRNKVLNTSVRVEKSFHDNN